MLSSSSSSSPSSFVIIIIIIIRHTTKSAQHTVEEDETLGIIAAKYKTTVEQIIKLNKETLAEGDVEVGMVIRVPVVDRRKSSNKNRSTSDFLSSLSTQFGLEGGEEEEGGDATETRCLILSSGGVGPRTVSQGFLILDMDTLILSWGREDPMTIAKEDLNNIALVYGAHEVPDFHGMLVEKFDHCGAAHRLTFDSFDRCLLLVHKETTCLRQGH